MQPSITLRAAHKPLIRFLGPRSQLWKDAPHASGPHPLTPANLEKHVATANPATPDTASKAQPQASSAGAIEFGQLASKYRRAPITEIEMEAIESGGATYII